MKSPLYVGFFVPVTFVFTLNTLVRLLSTLLHLYPAGIPATIMPLN
ncbi:hypothetical protein P20652_3609 [Pseudoalteromonas sp. BSi20652]|nr:hypothetical protein P20652_3609 [Pseudoalteromonas sp. BSi20652]